MQRWCWWVGMGLMLLLGSSCADGPAITDAGQDGLDAGQVGDAGTFSDGDGASEGEEPTLTPLSPASLFAALENKDFLLINVHIPRQGEIPGTDIHISYLDPDALAAYLGDDPDRYTVLYCMTDHMALIAGEDLLARGYRAIAYLQGGMQAWQAAGYSLDP